MHFFAFNLEKFTPDIFFYTGTARGARDKYEVWTPDYSQSRHLHRHHAPHYLQTSLPLALQHFGFLI